MVGWHHQINGQESEQALGDGEGQESVAFFGLWDRKESDMIERLNPYLLHWQADHLLPTHQFSSVPQSCPALCNLMDCSTPGLPVHHQLPDLTQTHVHRVCDAIEPSHPLPSPSPTFNLSQHQGFFQ